VQPAELANEEVMQAERGDEEFRTILIHLGHSEQ